MNRNQHRQRAINRLRLGFKHSNCRRTQFSGNSKDGSEQQENWTQLRNRRREQYRQSLNKNQPVTGENHG